ncbi:MAG: electron transport complex subunit RsxE [Thermodesulfobacteriota bacterium]
MAKTLTQEFVKGLWAEVPPFRLVLGLCPTLGVSTKMEYGIGMGLATAFVLICSNILIAMLRNYIPSKVRIASFIIIIATFVTVVELLMQAYTYEIFLQLGIFIPLIVVNCILLGRAEAFASKNGILASTMDGAGIGIGFTLALASIGAIREILGTGSLSGNILNLVTYNLPNLFGSSYEPFTFMTQAPGAFVCLGMMLCLMNLVGKK